MTFAQIESLRRSAGERTTCYPRRMGLLADLYVSTPGDAARYDEKGGALHCARLTRLTPHELSHLWAILQSVAWGDRHQAAFERVFEKFAGVRTIHRVPNGFAHVAAALDAGDIDAMAERWAAELTWSTAETRPCWKKS